VLGTRGLLGLGVPAALGGAGLGLRALCCALEEMGRTHPLWGHTVEHNGLGAWALAQGFPAGIVEAHLPSLLNASVRANVLSGGDARLGDGGFSGEARGDGRRDAGLWVVSSSSGVALLGPQVTTELHAGAPVVERDLPEVLAVQLNQAVPLAWLEGGLAPRLVQAQQLTATARLCGVTAHVLELWRASLQGRPDASRVTQVQRLGQAWTALAQVRAVLWSAVMRVDGGEDAAAPAGAACRSARLMCVGTLERALHGAGVEALRSRSRLRDHLKTARRLGATLATLS
jgi:alkylation response protein AidB-like acyl-CoA dehydrogenase